MLIASYSWIHNNPHAAVLVEKNCKRQKRAVIHARYICETIASYAFPTISISFLCCHIYIWLFSVCVFFHSRLNCRQHPCFMDDFYCFSLSFFAVCSLSHTFRTLEEFFNSYALSGRSNLRRGGGWQGID